MGSICGGGSNTVTTKPNPELMKYYRDVVSRAQTAANKPFQRYTGQMVAPLSGLERTAMAGVGAAANAYQPYFAQAQQYGTQAARPISATPWSASELNKYMDPYQQQVINATMANIRENNAQQQQGVVGSAINAGAWGGDRSAVAQSELARQQDLASNATLAGMRSQGYQQAQAQFNQQQGVDLQSQQMNAQNAANAANTFGNLGVAATNSGLAGINAEAKMGMDQRQVQQARDTANYQQFLNQQAYPFQSTQFLGNVVEGIGGQAGGTTTYPAPSMLSQIGGIALGAIGTAGQFGAFANRGGRINARRGFALGGAPGYNADELTDDAINASDDDAIKLPGGPEDITGISRPLHGKVVISKAPPGKGAKPIDLKNPSGDVQPNIEIPGVPPPSGGVNTPVGATPPPPAGGGDPNAGAVDPVTGLPLDYTGPGGGGAAGPPPPTADKPPGLTSGDKWGALASLGFGMAAGTSPFAGVNIGQGGMAAQNFLSQQKRYQLELQQLQAQRQWREAQLAVANKPRVEEIGRDEWGQPVRGIFDPSDRSIVPIGSDGQPLTGAGGGGGGAAPPGYAANSAAEAETGVANMNPGIKAVDDSYLGRAPQADPNSAYGKLSPTQQHYVDNMLLGKVAPPTGASAGKPYWAHLMSIASERAAELGDPDLFDMTRWATRNATRRSFGAGKDGETVVAGQTAIQHLGDLASLATQLNNSDLPVLGKIINSGKNWVKEGSKYGGPLGQYVGLLGKYAEEATKFYRGSGGAESDVERDIKSLSADKGPTTLLSTIHEYATAFDKKVNALQSKWHNAMGEGVPDYPLIDSKTGESLKNIDSLYAKVSGAPAPGAPAPAPAADLPVGTQKTFQGHVWRYKGGGQYKQENWEMVP